MIYGYARVSSKEQKLDRQLDEFSNFGIDKLYTDKLSGKNMERPSYQELRKTIKKGDLLVVSSIDRLGRNYDLITEEWRYITKVIGADIKVLDMPILDTRENPENITSRLISDIVLQLLGYVAQVEREKTKARQRAGIESARKRGVHLGREALKLPENANEFFIKYHKGELTQSECAKALKISRATFIKNYRKEFLNESI